MKKNIKECNLSFRLWHGIGLFVILAFIIGTICAVFLNMLGMIAFLIIPILFWCCIPSKGFVPIFIKIKEMTDEKYKIYKNQKKDKIKKDLVEKEKINNRFELLDIK